MLRDPVPTAAPRLAVIPLLALAVAPAGCGDPQVGPLVPARGHVTYNGLPLAGAELTFHPRSEGPGWLPVAVSDDDGAFALGTRLPGDGAPPGRYAVAVRWNPLADADDDAPSLLPEPLADPDRSGIEVEIRPGADAPLTLDLTGPNLRGLPR